MKLGKLPNIFEALEARDRKHKEWHKWYAWRPVPCDGVYHWLEFVERKGHSTEDRDGGRDEEGSS